MTHRLGSWTPPDDAATVLALRGVHAGYPGAPGVLDCVSLTIGTGRRIAILGANGSGKSSLLAAIAGELSLGHGTLEVSARRIGFLRQEISFAEPHLTPLQAYGDDESQPGLDALGLLPPRDARRPIGQLSLGQQQRLARRQTGDQGTVRLPPRPVRRRQLEVHGGKPFRRARTLEADARQEREVHKGEPGERRPLGREIAVVQSAAVPASLGKAGIRGLEPGVDEAAPERDHRV